VRKEPIRTSRFKTAFQKRSTLWNAFFEDLYGQEKNCRLPNHYMNR